MGLGFVGPCPTLAEALVFLEAVFRDNRCRYATLAE
jgi:hypothetical protein